MSHHRQVPVQTEQGLVSGRLPYLIPAAHNAVRPTPFAQNNVSGQRIREMLLCPLLAAAL